MGKIGPGEEEREGSGDSATGRGGHPEVGTVRAVGIFLNIPLFPRYQYPSLDQLADMIPCILQYLK